MDVFVIAGPNGSGKTTSVTELLPKALDCDEYINADSIAKALSPFHPDRVAVQAGKLALKMIQDLTNKKINFAFESTLASKTLLRYLQNCKKAGYTINIIYLRLQNPELAIKRVQDRVNSGGHNIPKAVIIRRYKRSLDNFKNLYLPVADNWVLYDNSGEIPVLVARQQGSLREIINQNMWDAIITQENIRNAC